MKHHLFRQEFLFLSSSLHFITLVLYFLLLLLFRLYFCFQNVLIFNKNIELNPKKKTCFIPFFLPSHFCITYPCIQTSNKPKTNIKIQWATYYLQSFVSNNPPTFLILRLYLTESIELLLQSVRSFVHRKRFKHADKTNCSI